jgi:hypothetical protein
MRPSTGKACKRMMGKPSPRIVVGSVVIIVFD